MKPEQVTGKIGIVGQPHYEGTISPFIYGDFVEFLNDMIPGMWAEKVEDRCFEGITQPMQVYPPGTNWVFPRWRTLTSTAMTRDGPPGLTEADLQPPPDRATLELDRVHPFCGLQSARVTISGGQGQPFLAGVEQPGIAVREGERLKFEIYIRHEGADTGPDTGLGTGPDTGTVTVRLGRKYGAYYRVYDEIRLPSTGAQWHRLAGDLLSPVTDDAAVLSIGMERPGTFWLDKVSLVPEDNLLGWRPDVVKAIRELKPGMIRFGGSSLIFYDWETGTLPRENRAPFLNRPWDNMESHDVGLFEFLQLCELVGAEPLVCTNSNSSATESILHEIEFCNGPVERPWGRRRAALGHPAPFGVRHWQIGNEQAGEEYERRLMADVRAIRTAYPDLVLMASYPSDRIIGQLSDELDYVCPHFYVPWTREREADFRALASRIRTSARNRNLKLGFTEWNVTAGAWGWGRSWLLTQYCALNAARVLQMYQRMGDMIRIANRSNLTNSSNSGILQTNKTGIYLTPTYYAQQAFATLSGDVALTVDVAQGEELGVSATRRSADGEIALFVVNSAGVSQARRIDLAAAGERAGSRASSVSSRAGSHIGSLSFRAGSPVGSHIASRVGSRKALVWTLAADSLDAVNSWCEKTRVSPKESFVARRGSELSYAFPPYSLTVMRFP